LVEVLLSEGGRLVAEAVEAEHFDAGRVGEEAEERSAVLAVEFADVIGAPVSLAEREARPHLVRRSERGLAEAVLLGVDAVAQEHPEVGAVGHPGHAPALARPVARGDPGRVYRRRGWRIGGVGVARVHRAVLALGVRQLRMAGAGRVEGVVARSPDEPHFRTVATARHHYRV